MSINSMLDRALELPQIPQVVQELIDSFGGDSVNTDEIAKKIGMDQVLTAKLLRLANSSRFSGQHSVSSVNEAVVRMGFNAVRTLVLASSMVGTFKAPDGFNLNDFWRDSFAIASYCRWLAQFSPLDVETAFTCGMMHNIGELMIHILLPEDAIEIDKVVASGGDRIVMEDSKLGFNYTLAGAELAKRWRFPELIQSGLLNQAKPDKNEDMSDYGTLIYLAKYLHQHFSEHTPRQDLIASFPNDFAQNCGIDLVKMLASLDEIENQDMEIDGLLH